VPPALIDTDTLSEVMRGRDPRVRRRAAEYLAAHGRFAFSVITRYEILPGLKAKQAARQVAAFEARCRASDVLPLSDAVVDRAAEIYGELHRAGQLISDADILIAATALVHGLPLMTNNAAHFSRVPGLTWGSWRS
jgi:tRNA(fMet)-specific endonuclease VapC